MAQIDWDKIKNCLAEIGPRGQAQVTTQNRPAVRRWLTAWGVSSRTARALTLRELQDAYRNGTTLDGVTVPAPPEDDSPFTGAGPAPDYSEALESIPAENTKTDKPQPKQEQKAMPKNDNQTGQSGQPDVNQIAAMLSQLMGGSREPVDRDQVAAIVEEMAPELIAKHSRTLKIEAPDREPTKIEGAHKSLEPLVIALNQGVKVWMVGPAGSGKTTLAGQAAESLGLDFYSTGALSSDFRLTGFINAKGEYVRTPFREAFEHGGVFLLDEADASNPNVLVALNQALENDVFAFPDGMIKKSPDFRAIVAANTHGTGPTAQYVGRTRIDGATVDRFFFLVVGYDANVEKALSGGKTWWYDAVRKARQAVEDNGLQHIISPRATRDGAALLEAGLDLETVAEGVLRKGLDDNAWQKVKAAAGV